MQKILAILLVTIAAAVALEPKLECINGILGPTAEVKTAIAACKDPAVWGTEEGKKNPNCDGLCIAKAFGYFADGTYSKDLYLQWVKRDFGTNQEFATNHISNCFEKYASKIDKNDKTCVNVKAFDTCGWEMQPKLKC